MKKNLTTTLIIMLLFIFAVTFVITRSLAPFNQAKAETEELAIRRANLVESDEFYWYNGTETFFTITGKNDQGQPIIVIVQQDGGNIEVVDANEAITKYDVMQLTIERESPKRIREARIGIENKQPIWEVSFEMENGSLGYSLFSLTTGEWLKTIKNI